MLGNVESLIDLRSLMSVCGSSLDLISLAPGRSGPQFGASLFQLEHFAAKLQLGEGGYGPKLSMPIHGFENDPDLLPVSEYPQLEPYRSLQADRLRLTGDGKWTSYLALCGCPFKSLLSSSMGWTSMGLLCHPLSLSPRRRIFGW